MSRIRDHARYYQAPPGLHDKVVRLIRREGAPRRDWRRLAIAAAFLLIASLAANVALLLSRPSPRQTLADNIVAAHIRSLAGEHLLDVPSSDHHTVKPWFNGKLDFSPPVKDLDGFPLLGGRLEYFEGHTAAALVYGRRKHVINLFTWPDSHTAAEFTSSQNGYRLQTWSEGGMTYWAASDLNQTEFHEFIEKYRKTPL